MHCRASSSGITSSALSAVTRSICWRALSRWDGTAASKLCFATFRGSSPVRTSLRAKTIQDEGITVEIEFTANLAGVTINGMGKALTNAMRKRLYDDPIDHLTARDIAIDPKTLRDIATSLPRTLIIRDMASLLV